MGFNGYPGIIGSYERLVSEGKAVRVKMRGGWTEYRLTEKGIEAERLHFEELERSGAWKKFAQGLVLDEVEKNATYAVVLRRHHRQHGLYSLEEQPEIPGFPRETAESLASQPLPEPPEPPEPKKVPRQAARIIVGR
jgi:hypothetical protein